MKTIAEEKSEVLIDMRHPSGNEYKDGDSFSDGGDSDLLFLIVFVIIVFLFLS